MKLQGKVAVITGAGSGIGKATAKLLAKEGAKIGALGRDLEGLEKIVKMVQDAGGEAMPLVADISKPEQMEAAYKEVTDAYGRLDIVFANAGVNGKWAPIADISVEDWRHTLGINLDGTFYTIKFAVPYMKKDGGGAIVVTSSVNGTRMFSNSGASAYATSKAGQAALVKMLALEFGRHKIRINVICPGAIETSIDENTEKENIEKAQMRVKFPDGKIPLTGGEPGSSEQVADLVLFLSSDSSSHITGTEVWIDGGQSLLQG